MEQDYVDYLGNRLLLCKLICVGFDFPDSIKDNAVLQEKISKIIKQSSDKFGLGPKCHVNCVCFAWSADYGKNDRQALRVNFACFG